MHVAWYNIGNGDKVPSSKMKLIKQKFVLPVLIIVGFLAVVTAGTAFLGGKPEPIYSDAAIGSPVGFKLGIKDHYCTDQEKESSLVVQGGSSYGTDSNSENPDCARIFFDPGSVGSTHVKQGIYDQDFRIGISMAEKKSNCTGERTEIQWTPWASSGGGSSKKAISKNSSKIPDCLWLSYQTRPLPRGILINDARVGISAGKGKTAYTPTARNGGGWSDYSGVLIKPRSSNSPEPTLNPTKVYLQVKLIKTRN